MELPPSSFNVLYCQIVINWLYRLTGQIDGLNPASVMALHLAWGINTGDWKPMSVYWMYIVGPIVGAGLSALFFNAFYLPLFIRWKAKK